MRKSIRQVSGPSPNLYAEWRLRSGVLPVLHDDRTVPPERLLQGIWFHQRLRRDALRTLDGQPLRVLHPGFWNREAGPDFREAVIQLEGEAPRACDVEVDLHSSGWTGHRHHANPQFQRVALHVVWESAGQGSLPTLVLKPFLDAPLGELALWLGSDSAPGFPPALQGKCRAPLRHLPSGLLTDLLHQAALVRLQGKASHFQARARQAGWDQALWEGLFRALGYKHNTWPMQRLAELRPHLCPPGSKPDPLALQARLFGVAGLLPDELPKKQAATDRYLRRLWDFWWRERAAWAECTLPRPLWRMGGQRPANHPQRRLALAAHWLAASDLMPRLEAWCNSPVAGPRLPDHLLLILQPALDDFWSWHWTLRSPRLPKVQPLLGSARVTDLALNVVLPWLWSRAEEGKNEGLSRELQRRYLAWPPAQDNAVLRLARQRLLGTASLTLTRGATAQQGLLQIVRDFCEHAGALCDHCHFPDLVGQWHSSSPAPGRSEP